METKSQKVYTVSEIAELLVTVTGETCACNINGNDEWLPFVCKYCKDETLECPEPKEENACWKEYLNHLDKLSEYNEIGSDNFMKKYFDSNIVY